MRIAFTWPPAAVEMLRTRAAAGVIYGDIAREINETFGATLTSSAVSGKVSRIDMPTRGHATLRSTKRRATPVSSPPLPDLSEVRVEGGTALLDLRETHCRWPLWAHDERPEEARFCGTTIDAAHTYCAPHRALAYLPKLKRSEVSDETRQLQRVAQMRRWAKERGAAI